MYLNESWNNVLLHCSDSVALAVDSPELFNRISEEFCSKAMKFIVLLWGEKSSLKNEGNVPIFDYKEILDLGRESRKSLLDSDDKRMSTICLRYEVPFLFYWNI